MKKIVLFGDSLLAGMMNGQPSETLDNYLLDELTEMGFPGYEVVKQGHPGESSTDGVARVDQAVAAQGDFVVISFGTNDSLRQKNSVEAYGDNLKQMISAFDPEKVIVLTTGYLNTELQPLGDNARQQVYVERAKEVASAAGVNVIDLYHHITAYPKPNEFIQGDGIHPSEEGYHFLGALIARDIKNKLIAKG